MSWALSYKVTSLGHMQAMAASKLSGWFRMEIRRWALMCNLSTRKLLLADLSGRSCYTPPLLFIPCLELLLQMQLEVQALHAKPSSELLTSEKHAEQLRIAIPLLNSPSRQGQASRAFKHTLCRALLTRAVLHKLFIMDVMP